MFRQKEAQAIISYRRVPGGVVFEGGNNPGVDSTGTFIP
jgi:hypothetical protein